MGGINKSLKIPENAYFVKHNVSFGLKMFFLYYIVLN